MRVVSALACALAVVASAALAADAPTKDAIVPALQKGGFVLFMRHATTNPAQGDSDPTHLENVAAQRQLTEEGRAQARALGAALRALHVPIGRVLASKFQRTTETATLVDVGAVETSLDLTDQARVVPDAEIARRAAALRTLLSTPPKSGTNTLIVSHRTLLENAAGKSLGNIDEAEIVVVRPLGSDKYEIVARVPSARWTEWAATSGVAPATSSTP